MSVVTCNGCFDGIHPGHLFFLGFCKAQGDRLIVGINSDKYIIENKRDKPLYNQSTRKKSLLALGFIDDVVVFNEETPISFLSDINPDIHCNGEEYGTNCIESKILKEMKTKLILVPRIPIWSTSESKKINLDIIKKTMEILV